MYQEKLKSKERRFGAALGIIGIFINILVGILLIPVLVRYLGKTEFGLYQLIGAFVGYFALMDFGISGTLSRYIAKYQAENDKTGQDNLFSMCLIIYAVIGLLLLLVGCIVYQNLGSIFKESLLPQELSTARIMFIIVFLSIFATILGRAYIGAIMGCERFIFSQIISITTFLMKLIVISAILIWGGKAIAVVIGEAAINLSILLLNYIYARYHLNIRFKLHSWDWSLFREVISYSFWIFIAALVLLLNFRLGRVILGIMTTTAVVAVYAIAMQINTIYNSIPGVVSRVFLPQAMRLAVNNATGEQFTKFMIAPSRYQLMLLGFALAAYVAFGKQFILLWVGSDYVEAWTVGLWVLIPVTIPLLQNTVLRILEAKSLNKPRALINLAIASVNVVISIFLVKRYGLIGPAIGTGIVLILGHGLILNLYYHYAVGLNMPLFFRETFRRILPVIIFSLVLGWFLNYLPCGSGWLSLILKASIYSTVYISLMWFYGMNSNEKLMVQSTLRSCARFIYSKNTVSSNA